MGNKWWDGLHIAVDPPWSRLCVSSSHFHAPVSMSIGAQEFNFNVSLCDQNPVAAKVVRRLHTELAYVEDIFLFLFLSVMQSRARLHPHTCCNLKRISWNCMQTWHTDKKIWCGHHSYCRNWTIFKRFWGKWRKWCVYEIWYFYVSGI